MRYRIPLFCAVAVLCTVSAAVVTINTDDAGTEETLQHVSPAEVERTKSENATRKAEQVVVVVYPVSDLPVWRYKSGIKTTTDNNDRVVPLQDRPTGKPAFDPTLLISNLKFSMGQEASKEATIMPHETTVSLVIRTTRTNHDRIAELLETLRIADQRRQARATKGNKKLTLSQPKFIMPPDPLMQQLEAMPYKQRVHIPIDVEILVDR